MANVTFAVQGSQFPAIYSSAGPGGTPFSTGGSTYYFTQGTGTPTGFIGSGYLNGYPSSIATARSIIYPGFTNLPNGPAISVLMRCSFNSTAGYNAIWGMNGPYSSSAATYYMYCWLTGGNIHVGMFDANGSTLLSNVSVGAFSPTIGTVYDIVVTSAGTNATGSVNVYVNASSIGTVTPSANLQTGRQTTCSTITLGGFEFDVLTTSIYINEFVIWDAVINPSSVTLTSGTGSLNGASRTAFVQYSTFNGQTNVDPGIANVLSGTAYEIAGVSLTGTLVSTDPGIANVLNGTTYEINSVNKTGTLLSVDPGIANVLSGTTYEINSVSKTGTYVAPASTDPGVTNVLNGVTYEISGVNKTGTLVSTDPGVGNVLTGTTYTINNAGKTGTLTSIDPGIGNVVSGTNYEINSVNKTGTYVPPTSTDPGVSNVLSGTTYEISGVNKTGTLVSTDPGITNVLSGTTYTINNTGKTGTLVSTDPGPSNVLSGTSYEINNVSKTGTLISTDPGVGNVLNGVTYEINNVPKTGILVTNSTDPGVSNVLNGVVYEINNVSKTGTLLSVDPGVQNVLSPTYGGPTNYKINNVTKVGTYIPPTISANLSTQTLSVGLTIPLCVQLFNYDSTKYVKAYLTDENNNAIGLPVPLLPVNSQGLYASNAISMPDTNYVIAQYIVYDDSGYTQISTSQGGSSDTFILNSLEASDILPLSIQLFDYNASKYIQAFIFDDNDFGSAPVKLTPLSNGLYTNFETEAPQGLYATVQYVVYDDSAYSQISTSEGAGSQVFIYSSTQINPGPVTEPPIGTLPNVSDALLDWFQPMVFNIVSKTIVNSQVVETLTPINSWGVWQPLGPQALMMKPEGQRQWIWIQLHCTPSLVLKNDDIVAYNSVNYRVTKKTDYSSYGFLTYELVNDYTLGGS